MTAFLRLKSSWLINVTPPIEIQQFCSLLKVSTSIYAGGGWLLFTCNHCCVVFPQLCTWFAFLKNPAWESWFTCTQNVRLKWWCPYLEKHWLTFSSAMGGSCSLEYCISLCWIKPAPTIVSKVHRRRLKTREWWFIWEISRSLECR